MIKNENNMERVLRIIIGAIIAILSYMYLQSIAILWIAYLISAMLLITGIIGFCPIYKILGISTN